MSNINYVKAAGGIFILILLLISGLGQANTVRVCECRACGCNYLDIQEAIDAVQPGDTVLVRSGNFKANVNVTKPVNLIGQCWHEGDLPLIDANGTGSAITVSADGVTVDSIIVVNSGNETGDAGIKVVSNNNTFSNNVAHDNFYGICLLNSSNNVLSLNRLFNNIESNAFDNGENQWDDGIVGNYYGNITWCIDQNNDSICDSAYNISGGPSLDRYPLAM